MLELLRRSTAGRVVRRLTDLVAWEEPWDYEDDDAEIDPLPPSAPVS